MTARDDDMIFTLFSPTGNRAFFSGCLGDGRFGTQKTWRKMVEEQTKVKTGQVNLDHLGGRFRGHFRGRLRWDVSWVLSWGVFEELKTGKNQPSWGAIVGALVGSLVGPLVGPLVGSRFTFASSVRRPKKKEKTSSGENSKNPVETAPENLGTKIVFQ